MIARLIDCLRAMRAYWRWLAEVHALAATDDAVYAADTVELEHARGGLETLFTRPDESPLVIQTEAYFLGREPIEGENIRQVAVWLRNNLSDYWWDTPEGDLQKLALCLLDLRDRCEDGRVSVS